MTKTKTGNWRLSIAEREERWTVCMSYLRRCGSIPAAQKAAKQDGKSFDTSVWVSALGKMLEGLGK